MGEIKSGVIDPARLKKGQIIARRYVEFWDRISLFMGSPYTSYVHYAILAYPIGNSGDWYTFNATVNSVVELVPLSRYRGQTLRVYSVKDGDAEFAWEEANRLMEKRVRYEGRGGWDYLFRLFPSLLSNFLRHGPRPIPWNRLPNIDLPDRINCLVLMRRCYPELIPPEYCATAAALEQAYRDGKLVLEQEGTLT